MWTMVRWMQPNWHMVYGHVRTESAVTASSTCTHAHARRRRRRRGHQTCKGNTGAACVSVAASWPPASGAVRGSGRVVGRSAACGARTTSAAAASSSSQGCALTCADRMGGRRDAALSHTCAMSCHVVPCRAMVGTAAHENARALAVSTPRARTHTRGGTGVRWGHEHVRRNRWRYKAGASGAIRCRPGLAAVPMACAT